MRGDDEPAAGPDDEGVRIVELSALDELRFDPADIGIAVGETVRFVVTNGGAIPHDLLIADEASPVQHEEGMQAGMGHEEMEGEMEGEHMGFPDAIRPRPRRQPRSGPHVRRGGHVPVRRPPAGPLRCRDDGDDHRHVAEYQPRAVSSADRPS